MYYYFQKNHEKLKLCSEFTISRQDDGDLGKKCELYQKKMLQGVIDRVPGSVVCSLFDCYTTLSCLLSFKQWFDCSSIVLCKKRLFITLNSQFYYLLINGFIGELQFYAFAKLLKDNSQCG